MTDHFLTTSSVSTPLQKFSVRALALIGWRVNFKPLPGPRGVIIVYPHTSNWDFIIGLLGKWAIGVRFRWLGKDSLFKGLTGALLGWFFRATGGEPIERSASTGAIARLAARIKAADQYWLVLAPEGTRKYRDSWRSGFYHIALTAGVPLGMATLDYRTKQVRLVHYAMLTGDLDTDLDHIRQAYQECRGFRHECAAPIRITATKQAEAKQPEYQE
ncbi:1-acyl-sn-glycerol-3-phosphate acyltransferase [Noviherbaspirillum massiliense]|uniref:1-acyl-sn-glycerol-3-phosphate acyltransferase n=1 Tax=Noviherbaspirillum massiliense TaxID=1465823 RepID=UPI0002E64CC5|nr:1-acyl-sn-glycerol-3-phosphate acyltransferase [Noviherbaspirillum massiliense]